MKIFLFVLLFAGAAFAGDRTDAYNLICKPLTFESDRNACMLKIRNFSYFDNDALTICAASTFDSEKMACLSLIGDKTYESYEIDKCEGEIFDSKKMECLRESGRVYNPNKGCVEKHEAVYLLTESLKDLRSGNLSATDQKLTFLLSKFNECKR